MQSLNSFYQQRPAANTVSLRLGSLPFSPSLRGDIVGCRQLIVDKITTTSNSGAVEEKYVVRGIARAVLRFRRLADFFWFPENVGAFGHLQSAIASTNLPQLAHIGACFAEHCRDESHQGQIQIDLRSILGPLDGISSLEAGHSPSGFAAPAALHDSIRVPPAIFSIRDRAHNFNYFEAKTYERSVLPSHHTSFSALPPKDPPQHADFSHFEPSLVDSVRTLFHERPIWTKRALRNNLFGAFGELKGFDTQLKRLLPKIAFYYSNGPWRDCWVAYGINPKAEKNMRLYQSISTSTLCSFFQRGAIAKYSLRADASSSLDSHLFAEADVHKSKKFSMNHLQFCDVHIRDFQDMLVRQEYPPKCSEREGWFTEDGYKNVKDSLRTLWKRPSPAAGEPSSEQMLSLEHINVDEMAVFEDDYEIFEDN